MLRIKKYCCHSFRSNEPISSFPIIKKKMQKISDKRKIYILFFALIAYTISCSIDQKDGTHMEDVKTLDLSSYPATSPEKPMHLLFIHHSTGGQLLADKGPDIGRNCIYVSNPNGGGLRRLLENNNYVVHEASYGSLIGNDTDVCHWNKKFRDNKDKILSCKGQDQFFTDGTRNSIVIFKSCFPNSWIDSEGTEPGDPDSALHTTANYKAAYNSLLEYFENQKDTLFVVMTAPPIAMTLSSKVKVFIKHLLGKSDSQEKIGCRIRAFNNWLKDSEKGWLSSYPYKNIVVFDYYDILTDKGKSNWSLYGSEGGKDSHPSSGGNSLAASEFISFLNRAVNRMGR